MVFTIDLDNESIFMNHEIYDVRANGCLAANMDAMPAPKLPKLGPQLSLAVGHCAT